MESPVSKGTRLKRTTLEEGLTVWECPVSGGTWIPGTAYWAWLSKHERLQEIPGGDDSIGVDLEDSDDILISPETGALLTRYRVGKSFVFSINRCARTGGIWLDKGEWEALRSRNLHDQIHQVFSIPWQKQSRRKEARDNLRARFKERLGEDTFEKVAAFKKWLAEQENYREIVTFLDNEDL